MMLAYVSVQKVRVVEWPGTLDGLDGGAEDLCLDFLVHEKAVVS